MSIYLAISVAFARWLCIWRSEGGDMPKYGMQSCLTKDVAKGLDQIEASMRCPCRIFAHALLAALVALAFVRIVDAQSQKFQFAVIGDTSYSKIAEQEFDRLMTALNKENLAFVIHVGDFEADPNPYERNPDKITMPCTDENFQRVLATSRDLRIPSS
jgi:hypothetical protein